MSVQRGVCTLAVLSLALPNAGCGGDEGVGDPVQDHSAYELQSAFDVQGDFGDSQLGSLLNMLRDMSDGEDDPGRFVVEQLIDKLPAPARWAASPFEGTLGAEANQAIYAVVPTAADEAKALAAALSSAARQFQIDSQLEVGLDDKDRFTGKHQIERIVYAYQQQQLILTRGELGEKVPPAVRIPVQIEGSELTIPEHRLKLPIGTVMQRALDRVIIPKVVANLSGIVELIARWFACTQVAAKVADTIGEGTATVLAACVAGAESVADSLTERLGKLDDFGQLRLNGSATAQADGTTYTGKGWSGGYQVGEDAEAPLDPQHCTFAGRKIP